MPSSTIPPPAQAGSWRKRHPVAARLVLYGLGLAVGLFVLSRLADRKEQDREDHVAYLWSRLEALPVVLQADPDGGEVLKALVAEYGDATLPAELKARVARLRGVVARNRKDRVTLDASYTLARTLDPASAQLSDLEWAQCLVDLGDAVAARQRIPEASASSRRTWAETVWAVFVRAQADALGGGGPQARRGLAVALDALPRPLPKDPKPTWFGLAAWQPSGAALEATRWMLRDPTTTPEGARVAWKRLAELVARDADALLACAEGLLAAGDEAGARGALDRLVRLDPAFASKALASRPSLAALQAK